MKVDTFQCDVCHKQKQSSNHWWKLRTVDTDGHGAGAIILPWDATEAREIATRLTDVEGAHHLCGAGCLNEWLSKNLLTAGAK